MKPANFFLASLFGCWFLFCLAACSLCPPCNPNACPPPACNAAGSTVYDECDCCLVCSKQEGEACGGNSNVGGTCGPGLYCSYRLGNILGRQRLGTCEPVICQGQGCSYRQICSAVGGKATCSCPVYKCTGKNGPVCGNNGKTYGSVCSLEAEECGNKAFVGIRQTGECPQATRTQQQNAKPNAAPFCAIPNVMDRVVYVGQVIQYDPSDSCHYLACYSQGVLAQVSVPGCIGGPVELDYGVTLPYVNGSWTQWEDISECTGPCSNATIMQRRNCTNPAPSNEGSYCQGLGTRSISCVPNQCQVDELCGYGAWSNWSTCSVTCGTGIQTRHRTANVQPTANISCLHLEEAKTCNMAVCVTTGNCRLRRSSQLFPGPGAFSDCITTKPHSVAFECRGSCRGSTCAHTWQPQNFNMSCPDGLRSVPVNVVVGCACSP